MTHEDRIEIVARVSHEARRAWLDAHDDESQAGWLDAREPERQAARDQVQALLDGEVVIGHPVFDLTAMSVMSVLQSEREACALHATADDACPACGTGDE